MPEVSIKLRPASEKASPIFQPASTPCGSLTQVVIMEKETEAGRTAVALLIELPDGTKVMAKTTALIVDGINAATRHGCLLWGDTANWKEWMLGLQVEAVEFASDYFGTDKPTLLAAYKAWKKKQGIDLDSEKIPGV